jgi:hypothetical protein
MANIIQKYNAVEREWRLSNSSAGSEFEILAFIKNVTKRVPFQKMLVESGADAKVSIDVEVRAYPACAPVKPYRSHSGTFADDALLFQLDNRERITRLDVLHRLAHYSLGTFGHCGKDDHDVKFAQRYLELVYRFSDDKASAPAKKAVKALMVKNRIKTYEHSEESKLLRDKRAKANELREQLAALRDD